MAVAEGHLTFLRYPELMLVAEVLVLGGSGVAGVSAEHLPPALFNLATHLILGGGSVVLGEAGHHEKDPLCKADPRRDQALGVTVGGCSGCTGRHLATRAWGSGSRRQRGKEPKAADVRNTY